MQSSLFATACIVTKKDVCCVRCVSALGAYPRRRSLREMRGWMGVS
jgi:hypothetical protein